jgi:hypothetical protein
MKPLLPISLSLVAIASMLVPTSVLAQNDFKVFVTGGNLIHELDLKATEGTNGQIIPVSGFTVEPNSVVQIHQNENLQVFTSTNEPGRIDSVKVTNPGGQLVKLVQVGTGWSLQGFASGVYLLDVIVEIPDGSKGAYETVLVILAPNEQGKDTTQVIRQVVKIDTQIIFKDKDKNKSKPDLRKICAFNPEDKRCTPDPKKGCPPGFGTNEAGQCFLLGPCPSGYHRANDDETGRCVPEKNLKQCEDGTWAHKTDLCPEDEEPIPTPPVDSCGCPIGENCPDVVCDEPVADDISPEMIDEDNTLQPEDEDEDDEAVEEEANDEEEESSEDDEGENNNLGG